jgi:hypothetical protein
VGRAESDERWAVSADRVGNDIITAAERVLRELNDGREPYAPSVMPMARVLAKLAQDPRFILAAAERLLREADVARVYFFRSPHVHGAHVHCYDRTESDRTLHEAYEALVAARKADSDAG